ncbi:MAG: patatin-like phospholipase family protein [Pseudomonadales bacterium]|nr:patatin-like phospholipase family protein [Pseudomonadales bacterium]
MNEIQHSTISVLAPSIPNRNALILPGGGLRVAYQAGAVQALYDAGLRFSYLGASSSGTLNLAALLSGVWPSELCRRWRELPVRPLAAAFGLPWREDGADFDKIERALFAPLGIDIAHLRQAQGVEARFMIGDAQAKSVFPMPPEAMTRELLLGAASLPFLTPPLSQNGWLWTDAAWLRECDLQAAVRSGANRLWVVWSHGGALRLDTGLLDHYMQMIEMSMIARLKAELDAIAEINTRIAAGEAPFGYCEPIEVTLITPEQPLPRDPDFLSGRIDAAALIAYGYRDARRVFMRGAPSPLDDRATTLREPSEGLRFREVMRGRICFGETDPERGYASEAAMPVSLHGVIDIGDTAAFVADPAHEGELSGHLEAHRLGGWLPATSGRFGLFTPSGEAGLYHMLYGMNILIEGRSYYFDGRKQVRIAAPWQLWRATTTLYVQLREGNANGAVVAAGQLHLGAKELFDLLSTLQAVGCRSRLARWRSLWRFLRVFSSELIRIYVLRRG